MTSGDESSYANRLPWLSDETHRPRRRLSRELVGWMVVAAVFVATIFYRAGLQSRHADESVNRSGDTSVVLFPEAPPLHPSTSNTAVGSRMQSMPVPAIPGWDSAPDQTAEDIVARPTRKPGRTASVRKSSDTESAEAGTDQPSLWSAEKIEGAAGRLVRVGNFRSTEEAEKAWLATMRKYPGMQRLPTRIVPIESLRDGRTQYRIQVGTTSQAHSEVVCQRVRAIHHSCIVIGLDEGSETRM